MSSSARRPRDRRDATIIACSLSDPPAFSEIFERHFEAVHAFLARRAGVELADDLAATTFTIAFERRGTFRDRTEALPWLYGIAANLLRNEWRARRSAGRVLMTLAAQAGARDPAGDDDRGPALAAALAELDEDQRDVLLLHVWEELRYSEIAAALGIPVGTVRSRLSRARSRLRRALEDERQPIRIDNRQEMNG